MRISVIIPVLNEERALGTTLSHTLALSFDEVVVVDGGSRDRTRELVASFMKTTPTPLSLLIASPGRASQMNAGAGISQGEALIFLHADTRLPADARTSIEQALQNTTYAGGRFDVRFEPETAWGRIISRMMNLRSRWSGIATGDQAIFVRRRSFEQLGGFRDVPIMEDIEFTRRLKRLGRIAALRSRVVTSYRRWEQAGPIRTIGLMWLLRALYWLGISPHTLMRMYPQVR